MSVESSSSWTVFQKERLARCVPFVIYSAFALIAIYVDFAYVDLDEWKRFDALRTLVFWLTPAVLVVFVSRFELPRQFSRAEIYSLLAVIWLSLSLLDLLFYFTFKLPNAASDRLPHLILRTLILISVYLAAPLVASISLKNGSTTLGLSTGGLQTTARLFLIVYPFIIIATYFASANSGFLGVYPFYKGGVKTPQGLALFLLWEGFYGLGFFATEFFFRGALLHGLRRYVGNNAVPIMTMFYVLIHLSKPLPECVGAMVGGSILGFISLKTGSIWFGVFCHLGIAWSMDLWAVLRLT